LKKYSFITTLDDQDRDSLDLEKISDLGVSDIQTFEVAKFEPYTRVK